MSLQSMVSKSYISSIEKGLPISPPWEIIRKLTRTFDVSLDAVLLRGDEDLGGPLTHPIECGHTKEEFVKPRRMRMSKWISVLGMLLICAGLVYVGASLLGIQEQKHAQKESMEAAQKAVSAGTGSTSKGKKQNGEAIGILRIPGLDREVPIVTGADEDDLEKGVGHVPSTALPGDGERIFLAGHRDTVFTRLGELKPGDVLEIRMAEGTFTYRMTDSKIVDQDDLSVMEPAREEVLTLSTCYPFEYLSSTEQRYIIFARPSS